MHILILGAGYAGLRTALDLDRMQVGDNRPVQVSLVERNPYHQHISLLHLAASSGAPATMPVVLPLDQILHHHDVRLIQGEAAHIDPAQQQVVLADGLALTYDRLVLALGGETSTGGVAGVREHAWPLRSYREALALRNHIVGCFRQAARSTDEAERRRLLTFAIVGGGFTGAQLAGELADWARVLCRREGLPTSTVRVALLERSGLLLKQLGDWASDPAATALERRGVSLHLHTSVQRVEADRLVLTDNRIIRTACVVWAAGIQAPPLLAAAGLPTDPQGRVLVDGSLRVQDHPAIFASGDCAHIPDPDAGIVPATASYAMRQGEYLARALLAEARGRPLLRYQPQQLGQIVSLGPGEAVGDPLGVPLLGPPAALLKQAVEQWYLTTLW